MQKKIFSWCIYFNLILAFDTVDHNIILGKLESYGIEGTELKWFKSYLSNRMQYVSLDDQNSSLSNIVCGVPQESILDPLLVLIYVNKCISVKLLSTIDTNLFISGKIFRIYLRQ